MEGKNEEHFFSSASVCVTETFLSVGSLHFSASVHRSPVLAEHPLGVE